jgi:chlorite dismutase
MTRSFAAGVSLRRARLVLGALLCAALVLGLATIARAYPADVPADLTPADSQAIRGVIEAQIDAFRRDDADAAFALASPSIQSQFETAANFMAMVKSSYQAVYHPRNYRFLELGIVEGYLMQKVIIIGPDGVAVVAMYPMIKLPDGKWRTDGCYLVPMESKGA